MSRGRTAGLLAVLVLLVGALAYGQLRPSGGAADDGPGDLTALRRAAALDPCPSGLSPALPALVLPCVGVPGDVRLNAAGTGRPAVVNVWGTWCGPCVREVPLLQDLHTRTDAVDVVGVLTQDTPENALLFAQDPTLGFDMTYPSVHDEQGVLMRRYGPAPPLTLFLDADGAVAGTKIGEIEDRAELDGLLREHLGLAL